MTMKKYELYVEGDNDRCIILSLGHKRNLKPNKSERKLKFGENLVEVKSEKSNDEQVYNFLRLALTNPSNYGALGIVIDADDFDNKRYSDRVSNFKEILKSIGDEIYDTENSLTQNGIIFSPKGEKDRYPKVGIWVMPDNNTTGAIEKFLWDAGVQDIYKDTYEKVLEVIKEIECENEKKIRHYIDNHHFKALVHTLLSWVEEPGNPMGTSIDKCVWKTAEQNQEKFFNWLNELYK